MAETHPHIRAAAAAIWLTAAAADAAARGIALRTAIQLRGPAPQRNEIDVAP